MNPENPDGLIEWSNYVAKQCLLGCEKHDIDWEQMIDDIESQYETVLAEMGFEMAECHEICKRKDTKQMEEPEEQEMDANVPHLLNSLGKLLVSYLRGSDSSVSSEAKQQEKKRKFKAMKSARLTHAIEVLRSAHHFHDKLGSYHLACLYAAPSFADEEVGRLSFVARVSLNDIVCCCRPAGRGWKRPIPTEVWKRRCKNLTSLPCMRSRGS